MFREWTQRIASGRLAAVNDKTTPVTARELLAANLRRLRKQRKISQERLSEMAGLHRTYVSQLERCKWSVGIDTLEQLALGLGVETWVLLSPTETEPRGEAPAYEASC